MMQATEGFPMRLPGLLLLLSSLLAAPLAATDTAQSASLSTQIQTDTLPAQILGAQQLLIPDQTTNFAAEADGICYKIRAYIFKRDDDHAPELTGSTTCGPSQPHAKSVVVPKPRLVPAD